MNNTELFKKIFGIYAEEFWAYPEEKMLDWLISDVPDINDGDMISRQAAIDAIRRDPMGGLNYARILKYLPSAEPKKGRWIADGQKQKHGYEWMHCSVCGFSDIDNYATHTNFCPNCGAKMEGEADEH